MNGHETTHPHAHPAEASRRITELLERNRRFADEEFAGPRRIAPEMRTIVVGCVDPRVDPARVLGLRDGDAVVIRNVAGRITPHFFQEMLMLRLVAEADGDAPGPGWNVVVLHHTDCGITRLEPYPDLLAGYFGVDGAQLPEVHAMDPRASVRRDVDALRAAPFFPSAFTITGLVYDVHTGLVDVVVPPARVRDDD